MGGLKRGPQSVPSVSSFLAIEARFSIHLMRHSKASFRRTQKSTQLKQPDKLCDQNVFDVVEWRQTDE